MVGENGKVYVHVQRGNETLHLVVMNNEHIAGGTSVYEVINQYQAFKTYEQGDKRDRRFDVTLLINGIPMIHIELKNKEHSYTDGFRQIKKYISEGKFHGLFSNVQMFVVSNAVDTKYFSAARDTELNTKFITGWLDEENIPVCDYIDFAKAILKIPEAHEMVTKYTVLDNDKKRLLILRPYQIHAIEAMRAASKQGKSGFIWHTTSSGDELKISEEVYKALPDFPRFAITYSLSENEESSQVNQDKMQKALDDYNGMFGTCYKIEGINAYNSNLNERLARKEKKYLDRSQQLDLVIVVDRLLTGFDAPCLSTLFMDRQPMSPQNIIQAFSRTNRLFDGSKQYGQIITFQSPNDFKNTINYALKLYSRGGDGSPLAEDWDDVLKSFSISIKTIHALAKTPDDIAALIAYNKLRVDFEYILELLQGVVESLDQSQNDFEEAEFEFKIKALREIIAEFSQENPKLSKLLSTIIDEIEKDKTKYVGQDISVIVNQMRHEAIDKEIDKFAKKWYVNAEDVRYEAYNFRDGVLANENNLKEKANYTAYKDNTPEPMPKFKFRKEMIEEFKSELMVRVEPLLE